MLDELLIEKTSLRSLWQESPKPSKKRRKGKDQYEKKKEGSRPVYEGALLAEQGKEGRIRRQGEGRGSF